ncbi:type 1 fimbrial protein [Klebsiella michiganensis]|uniref:fimbrial protein n=1 Tax=Klebsiella/Raoultella group TaxID=2890311 RepID=UPI0010334AAD|nr:MULTISPECIES: fimbrial protein [Klebsiella/Raoultella group]MCF6692621.1 type 1 fimbrial protein [Raoultella terrigena]MEB4603269.1 type 1 fimbrial protein [Raoultella ornithinolytica]MEB7602153.1 type 1 fimbrial protein [Raoultella terrigena]MEB8081403.1 type 1 fimbrial protein [Klebsiella michiganensis]
MKKIFIASCIASSLLITGVALAADQNAASGKITFNGALVDNTCKVVVDNQTNNATVTLPTISVNQLTGAAGKVAGRTGFNIALSDCTGTTLKGAQAYFEENSTTVDLTTGRLKNTSTSGANNTSLQLLDASNSDEVINVGNSEQLSKTTYVDIASGTATLPYAVQYYAETAAPTQGLVNSYVFYSIAYN